MRPASSFRHGRRKVRGARALEIVPRLVTELEVNDVLLGENLIEECLASHGCSQSVIGALFVQLLEATTWLPVR